MASVSQLSAGRTVYGSGSYSPTRGPVSAAGVGGYVKRGIANRIKNLAVSKMGNDGRSDSRSGLAKAALNRVSAISQPVAKASQTITQQPVQKTQSALQAQVPTADQKGSTPLVEQSKPQTSAPTGTVVDTVQVNSLGQLQLPYSANWGWEVLQALESGNDQILQLQMQAQQEAQQYADNSRDLDKQYAADQANDVNIAAARGLVGTSAIGKELTNSATDYNNQKNSLDLGHGNFQQGIIAQRNSISSGFDNVLRKGALQLADENAQNAGTLGFGTAQNPTQSASAPNVATANAQAASKRSPLRQAAVSGKGQYVMKNNRSLEAVAKELHISVARLKAANPRNSKDGVIQKGSRLNIPPRAAVNIAKDRKKAKK